MEQAEKTKEVSTGLQVENTDKFEVVNLTTVTSVPAESTKLIDTKQSLMDKQFTEDEIIPNMQEAIVSQGSKTSREKAEAEHRSVDRLRKVLSIFSVLIPIVSFAYCWWSYSMVSPGMDIREFRELEKTALQINLDVSNSLANLTVGLLGGVWALVLGLEKMPKITGWEFVPLLGGSASLVLSYICYRLGLIKYVEMLFDAETIDISAGFVRHWPTWQFAFFIYGFTTLVIALLIVYRRL